MSCWVFHALKSSLFLFCGPACLGYHSGCIHSTEANVNTYVIVWDPSGWSIWPLSTLNLNLALRLLRHGQGGRWLTPIHPILEPQMEVKSNLLSVTSPSGLGSPQLRSEPCASDRWTKEIRDIYWWVHTLQSTNRLPGVPKAFNLFSLSSSWILLSDVELGHKTQRWHHTHSLGTH